MTSFISFVKYFDAILKFLRIYSHNLFYGNSSSMENISVAPYLHGLLLFSFLSAK